MFNTHTLNPQIRVRRIAALDHVHNFEFGLGQSKIIQKLECLNPGFVLQLWCICFYSIHCLVKRWIKKADDQSVIAKIKVYVFSKIICWAKHVVLEASLRFPISTKPISISLERHTSRNIWCLCFTDTLLATPPANTSKFRRISLRYILYTQA